MKEKAEILMRIFSGLTRAHGIYEITGKQKNTAKGIKKKAEEKLCTNQLQQSFGKNTLPERYQ